MCYTHPIDRCPALRQGSGVQVASGTVRFPCRSLRCLGSVELAVTDPGGKRRPLGRREPQKGPGPVLAVPHGDSPTRECRGLDAVVWRIVICGSRTLPPLQTTEVA